MKLTGPFHCEKCGGEIDQRQWREWGECVECNPFACDDGYRLAKEARAWTLAVERAERFEASKNAPRYSFAELCDVVGYRPPGGVR